MPTFSWRCTKVALRKAGIISTFRVRLRRRGPMARSSCSAKTTSTSISRLTAVEHVVGCRDAIDQARAATRSEDSTTGRLDACTHRRDAQQLGAGAKTATGFAASVGKETFDVTLNVDISNGKILSARMENPVVKGYAHLLRDAALTQCGDAQAAPFCVVSNCRSFRTPGRGLLGRPRRAGARRCCNRRSHPGRLTRVARARRADRRRLFGIGAGPLRRDARHLWPAGRSVRTMPAPRRAACRWRR